MHAEVLRNDAYPYLRTPHPYGRSSATVLLRCGCSIPGLSDSIIGAVAALDGFTTKRPGHASPGSNEAADAHHRVKQAKL